MGQVATVLHALSCDSCAKYVCNECTFHSECCDLCNIEFETQATELSRGDDYEIEVVGCCGARKSD